MGEELTAKGIIVSSFPQGEYGRRLTIVSDVFGKITAFANGAGKTTSKIIGAVRPMTCAEFSLMKGKNAWNLHSVSVIDSFASLVEDFDIYTMGMYILETGEYFSGEGMPKNEAKELLNLMFVSLKALEKAGEKNSDRDNNSSARDKLIELIRRVYELRLLVLQGEYTEEPYFREHEETGKIWNYVINAPLQALYSPFFELCLSTDHNRSIDEFIASERKLFDTQVSHSFNSLKINK